MLALLIASEIVLAAGGELAGPPAQTVSQEGAEVVAYGFSEVPPRSRLQAAYALADANARAEIVRLVRVKVTDSLKANETLTQVEVEAKTTEAARGILPALSVAQHGWRKIRRGGAIVLQVWSRISVPKAKLPK